MKQHKPVIKKRLKIINEKTQKNMGKAPSTFVEIYEDMKKAGWGQDLLTQNIEMAFCNIGVSFLKLKVHFELLKKANEIFNEADKLMSWKEQDGFIATSLFGRSIGCFLGAIRLSCSGQLPETWILLRACIENSLYAFYVIGNPTRASVWIDRHKDEVSKKKCKNIFRIGNIWSELQKKSPTISKEVKKFYEKTIDFGGHPNERSVFPNTERKEDGVSYALKIISADPGLLKATILYTLKASILTFEIFTLIFPNVFNQPNLAIKVQNLNKQVMPLLFDASNQLRKMAK